MIFDVDPVARSEFDRQIERDNMLFGIQQNTSDTAGQLVEANARIDSLAAQLDAANDELRTLRSDALKRDESNEQSAKKSFIIAVISLVFSAIAAIASVAALFKG